MAKGGLGKGLGALMGDASAETGSNIDFLELPINQIIPNPNQPRTDFSEERIEELTASIEKDGLLQPILVRPSGNGYEIIAGERRWQACKRLERTTIPARVLVLNDVETQQIALVENLQRDNLNPIEEARGYKRLIDLSSCMQKELAEAVSKKPTTISNALRLLDLPEEVQDLMFEGLLSSGHGRAILSVSDEEARIRLAKKIVDDHLSVRETENIARLYGTQDFERIKKLPSPRSFKLVARKLRQLFNTNVRVKSVRGKNRIEIEFKDEEELERIFALMEQSASAQPSSRVEKDRAVPAGILGGVPAGILGGGITDADEDSSADGGARAVASNMASSVTSGAAGGSASKAADNAPGSVPESPAADQLASPKDSPKDSPAAKTSNKEASSPAARPTALPTTRPAASPPDLGTNTAKKLPRSSEINIMD
ncbi:MAG: ParB/RepB/Spo0J family partition protein [Coriobacteriia bacterium]|nr:ParB/RepB/Spo0J family partition protein [Coriobacteriia bacterium]